MGTQTMRTMKKEKWRQKSRKEKYSHHYPIKGLREREKKGIGKLKVNTHGRSKSGRELPEWRTR